ncbi:MAG: thymidine kinase [Candidatus Marinimicrobia bacterium]|nr:thymidine kinase [Candidatus Neomarinimicrobiota bacterium]MDD5582491.1 thymidine kinase [Candidatus Neomarinimicrobiota bacterium]
MDGDWYPHKGGWLEVICGSMFSGKTEELIRRLRRAQIAKQKVVVFKPRIDDRYDAESIVSHNQLQISSIVIDKSEDILQHAIFAQVVGIDEVQFLDEGIVEIAQKLADSGKRVIIAGLDKDYRGKPFLPMPSLMAMAEYVTKLLAICVRCGAPANYTQRLTRSDKLVEVGASEIYEARCRHCFEPPSKNDE